jgi:hypothetical protein
MIYTLHRLRELIDVDQNLAHDGAKKLNRVKGAFVSGIAIVGGYYTTGIFAVALSTQAID